MNGLELFYTLKLLAALSAAVLLIYHMRIAWKDVLLPGQRWRYLCLLGFSFLAVAGSSRQLDREDFVIYPERIFAFILYVALIGTMVESIREARHGRKQEHY